MTEAATETAVQAPPVPDGLRAGCWFKSPERATFLETDRWYYVFSIDRGQITYGIGPSARARITGPRVENCEIRQDAEEAAA